MKEYIEREEVVMRILGLTIVDPAVAAYADAVFMQIQSVPSANVVPVKHGRWEDKPTGRYGAWQSWCSVCGKRSGIGGIESNQHKPYCPNCGAKMEGDK